MGEIQRKTKELADQHPELAKVWLPCDESTLVCSDSRHCADTNLRPVLLHDYSCACGLQYVNSIGKSHEGRDIPVIHLSGAAKAGKPQASCPQ